MPRSHQGTRFTKLIVLPPLLKPSCATQSKFVRLRLEVTGLANEEVFAFAVSPKESFGRNSGCFAGG